MPEISIIVPVYKVEQYLDRCINSILQQTFQDFELILVDDGSPDACPKMCDEWAKKDKRIRVLHKENGGQSSARNYGLDAATGKYIGFVDSDDWIAKDMYEYLYQLLASYNVDIAMCDYVRTKKQIEVKKTDEIISIYFEKEIDKFFYRIDGGKSFYSVWNRLYKREQLIDIKFIEGKINEDVDFTYKVYKKVKKIAVSNQVKYFYFKNDNGITRRKLSLKDLDLFEIWDGIVEKERNTDNYEWAVLNRMRATFTLYTKFCIYGKGKELNKKQLLEWKKEIQNNYADINTLLNWKRKILLLVYCKIF